MAAGRIVIPGWFPALTENGIPIPNVRAFFFLNGTTTLSTVYADEGLTTPLTNPVAANSSGQFPSIWADSSAVFSVSMDAPYGPPGQPFTFDGIIPSEPSGTALANKADTDGGNTLADEFRTNIEAARQDSFQSVEDYRAGSDQTTLASALTAPQGVYAPQSYAIASPITRTGAVLHLKPGADVTGASLVAPANGISDVIPTETIYGRVVIRDENIPTAWANGFVNFPNMGQALRVDARQARGQCAMYVSGDQRDPVIGGTAYCGIHSRNNQSIAVPKLWGYNPVVIKGATVAESDIGASETIGIEISVSNNTTEVGQPCGAGRVEGLFCSYIGTSIRRASAAITTGGLSPGWQYGIWIDGVPSDGIHISLRDEVSGNAGVRRGIDTTGVASFTDGAIVLGNSHIVRGVTTGGAIRSLIYMNSANEVQVGDPNHPLRMPATTMIFGAAAGHTVRPGVDNGQDLGTATARWKDLYTVRVVYNTGVFDAFGSGSPEGVVTASPGATYRRTDGGGGPGTNFYVKETGVLTNTGWVAK